MPFFIVEIADIGPTWANRGNGNNLPVIKIIILPKWSWVILDRLKMLPLSPLRFSTIGKPILRTFEISKISDFSTVNLP